MSSERITHLLNSYSSRSVTASEEEELFQWIATTDDGAPLKNHLLQLADNEALPAGYDEVDSQGMMKRICDRIRAWESAGYRSDDTVAPTADLKSAANTLSTSPPPAHRVHFLRTAWFRYAAILLLIAGTATLLYVNNQPSKNLKQSALTPDIIPGGNKAILTLADGSTILLDSAANGSLAKQGNTKIIKLDAGQLSYSPSLAGNRGEPTLYNTIATPRGGQYQVLLPDGSKVWLNAASSIKFPTAFTGKTREVEMTGEVYMEIAKNTKQPFLVKANGTEVQVLGTSFNMNAYNDEEAIQTTLIEGSVKVILPQSSGSSKKEWLLKPGEQVEVMNSQTAKIISNADIEKVMAWKNGAFNFNDADLPAVLRQLERWYDINVKYEGIVPQKKFKGGMDRNVNLSDMLEVLKDMGIKFKMEGRTLVVL
jgi:ferric-dicitrate binding protein FerR (iron transport regulator)